MKFKLICLSAVILFSYSCKNRQQELIVHVGLNDTTLLVQPFGMTVDNEGRFFIADAGNNCITRVDKNGGVAVYAGSRKIGKNDGELREASFNSPSGVCFDNEGNIIVAGFGGQNIRCISKEGLVRTVAGTGEEGYLDGPAKQAMFSSPRGVCVDSKGGIYVADCWNHRIRKISKDGMVSTFAGGGKIGVLVKNDWKDGPDTLARFDAPCGLAIDKYDNIYVADAGNNSIRKISPEGYVTTLAGLNKEKGLVDGPITEAKLNVPTEVFVTDEQVVYFSDTYNHSIRKIGKDGGIVTLISNINLTEFPIDTLNNPIRYPRGVCIYDDELFFVEWNSHLMKKFRLLY